MKKLHILLLMILTTIVCNTFVTLNMNVAILSMVRPSQPMKQNNTKSAVCPNTTFYWSLSTDEKTQTVDLQQEDTYDWNDYEKNLVLSAYHWLSWLSILSGSILAQKYGSKIVLGYAVCSSTVISSIMPTAADYGSKVVMYVRMIQGILSFLAIPGGLMAIVGNWSSEQNRGIFLASAVVGNALGTGGGSYLFGYIGQFLHWKYIFHFTSVCGIVWTLLWYNLIYDYPEKHPTISAEEKTNILENMKQPVTHEKIPVPWKDIFTSAPFIACVIIYGGITCNSTMFLTFLPLYIQYMFGLSSSQTGIILSIPQFCSLVTSVIFAWFVDFFIQKQWLSITNTRKLFGFVACCVASVSLISITFAKCNVMVIIASYIFIIISQSMASFGLNPAIIDMSPKFCGILYGLIDTTNELMTLAFVTGISYASKILSPEEYWNVVFLSTAGIVIVTSISFLIWGSAEVQPWNQGSQKMKQLNVDLKVEYNNSETSQRVIRMAAANE